MAAITLAKSTPPDKGLWQIPAVNISLNLPISLFFFLNVCIFHLIAWDLNSFKLFFKFHINIPSWLNHLLVSIFKNPEDLGRFLLVLSVKDTITGWWSEKSSRVTTFTCASKIWLALSKFKTPEKCNKIRDISLWTIFGKI